MRTVKTKKIIIVSLVILTLLMFVWMGWRMFWLESSATKQAMWRDYTLMRINNLKGCIKAGDKECPEGKYADSQAALQRLSDYDKTLPFSN